MRFILSVLLFWTLSAFGADEQLLMIGAARIDITPEYPVRLHGYGGRRTNAESVKQRIFAKAMAFGSDREGPRILFTVDNLGISDALTEEVAAKLKKQANIAREHVAVCASHTHSAPMLSGVAPNIFSSDIVAEQQAAIERYTRELGDKLERVAFTALSNRAPAKMSWNEGVVTFAKNRRVIRAGRAQFGENDNAPVDHTLAVMCVRGADDKVRAVLVNYACHCTTLGGEWNSIHGDWAGCAQEAIQRDYPGAEALVTIGCGADANPAPRGKVENAQAHGDEIAAEVRRLVAVPAKALLKLPAGKLKRFDLDFDPLPTRAQWEERAQKPGIVAYHAKKNLARLDRGENLPTKLPYSAQAWSFGSDLAMVFLPGEVVIDYQLRLKREFDASRLWVNAYANDAPCYIPSRRILAEGGYEAEDSLWYYDRPARLAVSTEDRIIRAVHDVLPREFVTKTNRAERPQPLSPQQALNSIRVAPEFTVALVAAEPVVVDPVAIDWGADGKLWVAEMHDYPMGLDGNWKPGGRVKFLQDMNGDNHYDTATLFLDGLPFPTAVFAWRNGVLICAAPDILYAEDTNGDGRADTVKKIFTGFATNNYQARVNSLSLGLDGWIYGANGLLGGRIRYVGASSVNTNWISDSQRSFLHPLQGELDIRGRDFRMNPDTGAFESASGLTQQGRVRDDFGNWFGCDNSRLLLHYPLADEYVRRNPHAPAPNASVHVPQGRDWNRVYPASRMLERFNDASHANRVTSACGLEIYRDELLGKEFYGNAFTCEPVHNLVHREMMAPDGFTFCSSRATNEVGREFLTSSDNWFRPVQVRTGPDGALWVVDMYRYVIEHPRWIPSNRLATLDVRAGDDKGRIYRVFRKAAPPRALRNFAKLRTIELVAALDSPSGPERDIIHRELLNRGDATAVRELLDLALNSQRTVVRAQAFSALARLGMSDSAILMQSFHKETEPQMRSLLLRLMAGATGLSDLAKAARDDDVRVRIQAALNSGEMKNPEDILSMVLPEAATNQWMRAAVLSSAPACAAKLIGLVDELPAGPGKQELFRGLLTTVTATASESERRLAMARLAPSGEGHATAERFEALVTLGSKASAESWASPQMRTAIENARALATNEEKDAVLRRAAILFAMTDRSQTTEIEWIRPLLSPSTIQSAAVDAILMNADRQAPAFLLSHWTGFAPNERAKIVERFASRSDWTDSLLAALESKVISTGEIPIVVRSRLMEDKDTTLARRAKALWPPRVSNRAQLVAEYRKAVTETGHAQRGTEVFNNQCAGCHALGGRGIAVGPDLSTWRNKSVDDFLVAILDPNAAIEPRFVNYIVQTRNGGFFYGVIRSETANGIELISTGIHEKIQRADVARIEASPISLMPEGLEQGITPQQMNDLLAFLRKPAPRPFGAASIIEQEAAQRDFFNQKPNGLVKLIFASEQLVYPNWLGRHSLLHCRQTDGKSRITWEAAPANTVGNEQVFTLPAAMGFISQPQGKFMLRVNGKESLEFNVVLDDHTWASVDGKVRLSYSVMEANAEDSNGVLTISMAREMAPPNMPVRFEVIGSAAASQRWFGIYDIRRELQAGAAAARR